MAQPHTKTSDTVSIRLSKQLKDRLDTEAARQERSRSYLAKQALEDYLTVLEEQDRAVLQAIESADRGEVVSHERASAWLESLGTDTELPMPKP